MHHRIIQKQLQMNMMKKYLNKDIYIYIYIYIYNTSNELSKVKTKNWVKINDESQGMYNEDNQIRFKTSMLKSSLCNHSDAMTC